MAFVDKTHLISQQISARCKLQHLVYYCIVWFNEVHEPEVQWR